MTPSKTNRQSSIELYKIIAIILIIISHVTQTLCPIESTAVFADYMINIQAASQDVQHFFLRQFSYFGMLGNAMFFIASAWFLCDSQRIKWKRWWGIVIDVWIISVFILVVSLIFGCKMSAKFIIFQFLPNTLANNWYITCYLLFYPLHPVLNKIWSEMSQKVHLSTSVVLVFLYVLCNFVSQSLFFFSNLILWIAIYFTTAYIKRYMIDYQKNTKKNLVILLIAIVCQVLLVAGTNWVQLKTSFNIGSQFRWRNNSNPFILLIAISLFLLFKEWKFNSSIVNSLSSQSLLIYILHENMVIRTFLRPLIWEYIFINIGYQYVVLIDLGVSISFFIVCLGIAYLYSFSLRKLVQYLGNIIGRWVLNCCRRIGNIIANWK